MCSFRTRAAASRGRPGRYIRPHAGPKSSARAPLGSGRGAILAPVDPASFLASHAPFDELGPEDLDALVAATDIVFFLRGETVLEAGGEPVGHLFMIRTGSVDLLDAGHVVDQQAEGEIFGALSLLAGTARS